MSCGLPVIGTNIEGIKEVIHHRENGILCDADAKSIREAIINTMEDELLKQTLGRKARETIEQRFSLHKLIGEELGLYLHLLS